MSACEFLENSYITSFRARKRQPNSSPRISSSIADSTSAYFTRPSHLSETMQARQDQTTTTTQPQTLDPSLPLLSQSKPSGSSGLLTGAITPTGSSSTPSNSTLEGSTAPSNISETISNISSSNSIPSATSEPGSELEYNFADDRTDGSEYFSSNTRLVNPILDASISTISVPTSFVCPPLDEPTAGGSGGNTIDGLITNHNKFAPAPPTERGAYSSTLSVNLDLDCAICLDIIQPSHHATATLACGHEFHLSCISMAFAIGKEMICPLCRYLHKNQPFMNQESDGDIKPLFGRSIATATHQTIFQNHHPFSRSRSQSQSTLHEHPTSGTVFSMMPSLFETSIGHGPAAGTIRTSSGGIVLKTSTWLLLYALPFTIAICFLTFVLGKVETMWSKISCLIGAAICYMVCWAIVVAIVDPDHEARTLLEQLNRLQESEFVIETVPSNSLSTASSLRQRHQHQHQQQQRLQQQQQLDRRHPSRIDTDPTHSSTSAPLPSGPMPSLWTTWTQHRYVQNIHNRVVDISRTLDDLPGDW
ncbi:hypothetical protein BGZ76_005460 [Entomortierella beljakovae]|nr:hypothetical protein BGZ76_005460 [Entomortierella beljakovae]